MARGSYHHGNLKQALVDAAIGLIEEKGPLAFTLTEAARLAGVSAAAPYRHFQGREDLLAEVARQGFEEFAARLTAAFDEGRPTPLSALQRVGTAYLRFARERKGLYMAMFESGMAFAGDSATGQAAYHSQSVLLLATRALFAHLPEAERPPAIMVAGHIWALSHGIVELFARGPGNNSPISPEDMLESGVLIYLRGLGVIPS